MGPFGNEFKLYCERGFHLAVRGNGIIEGTDELNDCDTDLICSSADNESEVRLKGKYTGRYICFGEEGQLYGEEDVNNPGTKFIESFAGSYTCYESATYPKWYIGLNKQLKSKPGPRTTWGKKSTKFLPRRQS
ncbi:fibroblast growth factor 1 [Aethina tumida]|uniref:fibroblast growth factor 1 n=1 Tax=Aethina tumida TaxID=116153 RepID=UPI00096AF4C1|nr:fibroblast growth factor 1 [Aethina tumida]XP_049817469.1 fibroblast growth factor 1 [Aethina tumida]XP_049817470.1 fibroblast growth factor 1 [Aethina tumida]